MVVKRSPGGNRPRPGEYEGTFGRQAPSGGTGTGSKMAGSVQGQPDSREPGPRPPAHGHPCPIRLILNGRMQPDHRAAGACACPRPNESVQRDFVRFLFRLPIYPPPPPKKPRLPAVLWQNLVVGSPSSPHTPDCNISPKSEVAGGRPRIYSQSSEILTSAKPCDRFQSGTKASHAGNAINQTTPACSGAKVHRHFPMDPVAARPSQRHFD